MWPTTGDAGAANPPLLAVWVPTHPTWPLGWPAKPLGQCQAGQWAQFAKTAQMVVSAIMVNGCDGAPPFLAVLQQRATQQAIVAVNGLARP